MSDVFNNLGRGLHEALTYARAQAQGKVKRKAMLQDIIVPMPDVRSIRAQTGLTQADFARSIGVKKATLLNWEQRRRNPDGPAKVLLALIEKDPQLVQRMLG